MRLDFTEEAERDLFEIGSFIARDSPGNAAAFARRLEKVCRLLAANPRAGRLRGEFAPGLRSLPHNRYVIFYREIERGIVIIRVLHGARDLRRILENS